MGVNHHMRNRALIVTDLQNDFIHPQGALFSPGSRKALMPSISLIESFAAKGLPIITTQDWHWGEVREFEQFGPHCIADSKGAQLVEEVVGSLKGYNRWIRVYKPLFSAVEQTPLDHLLREMKIHEVHVCGVTTHICVLYTIEGLFYRGYDIVVYPEALGSFREEDHRFALRQMKETFHVHFSEIPKKGAE